MSLSLLSPDLGFGNVTILFFVKLGLGNFEGCVPDSVNT